MRALIMLPFCLVAACSGGESDPNQEKGPAAASLEAGQWETSFETTGFRSTDQTEPALEAEVGDKESHATCIAEAVKAKPDPELFAGAGYDCSYKSSYIKNGRLNASLSCRRAGVDGEIMMSVQGSYTGTTFEGTVDTTTYLPGDGDFAMTRKFTGRRTAEACAPTAVEGQAA